MFVVSEISGEGTNQRGEEESEEDDGVKVHLMQYERDFFPLISVCCEVERRRTVRTIVTVKTGGFSLDVYQRRPPSSDVLSSPAASRVRNER